MCVVCRVSCVYGSGGHAHRHTTTDPIPRTDRPTCRRMARSCAAGGKKAARRSRLAPLHTHPPQAHAPAYNKMRQKGERETTCLSEDGPVVRGGGEGLPRGGEGPGEEEAGDGAAVGDVVGDAVVVVVGGVWCWGGRGLERGRGGEGVNHSPFLYINTQIHKKKESQATIMVGATHVPDADGVLDGLGHVAAARPALECHVLALRVGALWVCVCVVVC